MKGVRVEEVSNEANPRNLDVLRAYEGEDIELQLPENLTVYDIDYLAVWCVAYKHNFGHVQIPPADDLWVPPALGQTRIKVNIQPAVLVLLRHLLESVTLYRSLD
ncbi:Protein Skeletor, isoforms B/C [Portunus trituberculatus]|uniref:Protein Skeletor, isoforms B/C n=1 Tax=Portunus trituberculatus TaxID=210409 RepID=A0A5B7J0A6_PORTR|nr:Protein Skeletor, isoforms B/C [Portunus trituberculatus]